jgi:hypothetical protein
MLTSFSDLLRAAGAQQEPQRLLLVFVRTDLPASATEAQRQQHRSGQGGTLAPVLCVDKLPAEIASFQALLAESERTDIAWDLLFVGGLAGRAGMTPSADEAMQPLRFMVNAINEGRIDRFAVFDRQGVPVRFG